MAPVDGLEQLLDRINTRKVLKRVIELWCAVIRHRKNARKYGKAAKRARATNWSDGVAERFERQQKDEKKAASQALRQFHQLMTDSVASQETLFPLVEPAEEAV